ncbi:MAG: hypothetical protein COB54_02585 [Alphaproteobacteria bacterium]|nr:MAG: hypothetical protein COB54_02585 [Alphaproteobacteria bacterium]
MAIRIGVGVCCVFVCINSLGMAAAYSMENNRQSDRNSTRYVAEPAYTQIFKENIQAAVANHPRTAAMIALRDGQRYRQREAKSGLYPTLEVGVSGRYRLAESFENRFDNITERSRRSTSAHASLTGRQLLYDAGQTSSRVASAKHTFTAAHEEYGQMASRIALQAVENHFQVLFQRRRQLLQREVIDDHSTTLAKVKLRFESGRGAERDVALLESRLALSEADASTVRKDLDTMVSRYEETYGFAPETLKRPQISLDLPSSLQQALETGFQNNPALRMAGSITLASKATIAAEKADRLPHVSLEVSGTKYDLDRGNNDYDITGRLILNYSLYRGGATKARIARSLKDFDRARHDEADQQRQVEREIKVAFKNRATHDNRVRALKKATEASRRNSDQLLEQFEATGGSLLALLEARKDYYQAREQYMASLIEQDILRFRLLDTMGTLNAALNIRLKKSVSD